MSSGVCFMQRKFCFRDGNRARGEKLSIGNRRRAPSRGRYFGAIFSRVFEGKPHIIILLNRYENIMLKKYLHHFLS